MLYELNVTYDLANHFQEFHKEEQEKKKHSCKVRSNNEQCRYHLKAHTFQSDLAGEMQKLNVDYTF